MKGQPEFGIKLAFSAIGNVIQQSSKELVKSDVIGSLTETSRIVRSSQAPRRIVLVVSNMLENSSIDPISRSKDAARVEAVLANTSLV
jgi:hypothetical protein